MNEGDRSLQKRVEQAMRVQCQVKPGETLLAAVSGGADSLALLLLLRSLQSALKISVEAAHFDHGIRGSVSREDARFVEAFCLQRDVPCHVGHGDVPALAAQRRCSLEEAARQARYAFLDAAALAAGADRIALAHQREDQAETILLHLTYGCGLQGLTGMRFIQGNRIRPLLDVSRAELEAYLAEQGVVWREDATNQDTAYTRNYIRHEIMPKLRRLNPRADEAIARTGKLAALAQDTLTGQADELLRGRVKSLPYGAFWFLEGLSPTGEAVRRFAASAGVGTLDAAQTSRLVSLIPGSWANLPGGWRAYRSRQRLHLLSPDPKTPKLRDDDFHRVTAENTIGLGDGIRHQAFDADALQGAVFRYRQDGDVFAPLGTQGTQKLKQTLRDAGIDRPFRGLLPVLAKGKRVLWIVGVKPSREAAVHSGSSRVAMIHYLGDLPWELPSCADHTIKADEMEEPADA